MKVRIRNLSFAAAIGLLISGFANADLAGQIDQIIRQDSQKTVEFSIHIIKAESGKSIYSHQASKPMVPASNMKVITGAASLRYLGAEYEFKTQVIAASMRHPVHVTEAALAGAHVATVPYDVLKKMLKHNLTDEGIQKFLKDWEKVPKNK